MIYPQTPSFTKVMEHTQSSDESPESLTTRNILQYSVRVKFELLFMSLEKIVSILVASD